MEGLPTVSVIWKTLVFVSTKRNAHVHDAHDGISLDVNKALQFLTNRYNNNVSSQSSSWKL